MTDAERAAWLCSAGAVRERCTAMLAVAEAGGLLHLDVDLDRLPAVADYTAAVVRAADPALSIPHHARWRHFSVGGVDRWGALRDALGEVTKFLVYNARKRQEGGDRADAYFERTECVAGVQDMRFQELMPDVLHWLGITRIDRLVSMSNLKYAPIVGSGIEVVERVPIPERLIPADASVEMDAKKAAGYFTASVPGADELHKPKGRGLDG